jgi:predicted DNA-binding transcriptional regulator YafY
MKAMNSKSIMAIRYFSFDDVEPKERKVIPKKLYRQGDNWYIDAYDLNSGAWKTYQTNRIIGEVEIKPASEIELNLLKKTENVQPDSKKVRIKINQDSYRISHITGGTAIDGKTIEFKYFEDKSFAKYLLRLSAIIVSIDNDQIRSHYKTYLEDFLKALHHD